MLGQVAFLFWPFEWFNRKFAEYDDFILLILLWCLHVWWYTLNKLGQNSIFYCIISEDSISEWKNPSLFLRPICICVLSTLVQPLNSMTREGFVRCFLMFTRLSIDTWNLFCFCYSPVCISKGNDVFWASSKTMFIVVLSAFRKRVMSMWKGAKSTIWMLLIVTTEL